MADKIIELLGDDLCGPEGMTSTATMCDNKKAVLLYFSAHWCPPCRGFTPTLVKAFNDYKTLSGDELAVCFVSSDRDESSFSDYFSSMTGFHALPFAARDTKEKLSRRFAIEGIPSLVLLDVATGERLDTDGDDLRSVVAKHGASAFPLTPAALKEVAAKAEAKRAALLALLAANDASAFGGDGAIVAADASASMSLPAFIAAAGESAHVALLFGDGDGDDGAYASYAEAAAALGARLSTIYMPWKLYNDSCDHAPFRTRHGYAFAESALNEQVRGNLTALSGDAGAPLLMVLKGSEVLTVDGGLRRVQQQGAAGFPWDDAATKAAAEREAAEVAAFEKAYAASGLRALKTIGDFDGSLAPPTGSDAAPSMDAIVDRLAAAGEDARIALYFSAHWCGPCRSFTPQFAKVYNELREAGKPFEVIFVSSDRDAAAFDEYHASMPWPALPFAQRRLKEALCSRFGVNGIPSVVLLRADGTVADADGRGAVSLGSEFFPWSSEQLEAGRAAKRAKAEAATAAALKDEHALIAAQEAMGVAPVRRVVGVPAAWGALDVGARTVRFDQFATVAAPTLAASEADVYYEVEILDGFGGVPQLGFAKWTTETMPEAGSGNGVGDDDVSWGVDGKRGAKWHAGSQEWGVQWHVGDVVSLAYSPVKGTIATAVNGGELAVVFDGVPTGCYPAMTGGGIRVKYNVTGPFEHAGRAEVEVA